MTNTNESIKPVVQPDIFKSVRCWEVEYHDLNELIRKEFDLEDFEYSLELGNDTIHRENAEIITDEFWLNKHKQDLEEIKNGNWEYKTRTIMNELAMRGKILPGDYLVNVSW